MFRNQNRVVAPRWHSHSFMGFITLLLAVFIVSCGDWRTASTEVENEIAYVEGIAATGPAMSNAAWELFAPSGMRLAQGTTDSAGAFRSALAADSRRQPTPWLLRVVQDSDTIVALLHEGQTSGDTLFGLVNPITDLVARQLLGPAAGNPLGGYQPPTRDSIDVLGQKVVDNVFGPGVEWQSLSRDRDYKPVLQTPPPGYAPSPSDLLLHSLEQEATRRGITVPQLLDLLYSDPEFQALLQEGYRLDLAASMVLYGLDYEEALSTLRQFEVGMDPVATLYFEEAYGYKENDLRPGAGQPGDPFPMIFDAVNRSVQNVLFEYPSQDQAVLQGSLALYSQMVTGILLDWHFQAQQPKPDHLRVTIAADACSWILGSLQAASLSRDTQQVLSLVQTIFTNQIQPRLIQIMPISREEIESWVAIEWPFTTPAFRENPMQTSFAPDTLATADSLDSVPGEIME